MVATVESNSTLSQLSKLSNRPANQNVEELIKVFCRQALRGINPEVIRDSGRLAYALNQKARLYENDRSDKARRGIATSADPVVFQANVVGGDSATASIAFDVRRPDPSNRTQLLQYRAMPATFTFEQVLELAGLPKPCDHPERKRVFDRGHSGSKSRASSSTTTAFA